MKKKVRAAAVIAVVTTAVSQARDYAREHPDEAGHAVDKVEQFLRGRLAPRHGAYIDKGGAALRQGLGLPARDPSRASGPVGTDRAPTPDPDTTEPPQRREADDPVAPNPVARHQPTTPSPAGAGRRAGAADPGGAGRDDRAAHPGGPPMPPDHVPTTPDPAGPMPPPPVPDPGSPPGEPGCRASPVRPGAEPAAAGTRRPRLTCRAGCMARTGHARPWLDRVMCTAHRPRYLRRYRV